MAALGCILYEEAVEVEGGKRRRKCSGLREEQSCAPKARENGQAYERGKPLDRVEHTNQRVRAIERPYSEAGRKRRRHSGTLHTLVNEIEFRGENGNRVHTYGVLYRQ